MHVGCTYVGCTHVVIVIRLVSSQCCKGGYKWFWFTLCCYSSVRLRLWLHRVSAGCVCYLAHICNWQ